MLTQSALTPLQASNALAFLATLATAPYAKVQWGIELEHITSGDG